MAKFKKKSQTLFSGSDVVEAITFDELVKYGIDNGGNVVNGMPWSFNYKNQPITHENDTCYLVPNNGRTLRFERGDLLADMDGELVPFRKPVFHAIYEPMS